jgi:pimeloyl-ACP methyl ester carboxylesterase
MRFKENVIDVRGLKIHFVEWGERAGEPLLLIHGFLDHARSWDPFVEVVNRISRKPLWIIAPDCRGHGDSGWVGAGGYYHFPDYLLDLDTLILSFGVPSVTLMGHSMGGTISFLYSGAFPRRVSKLVLVEGLGPRARSFADAPHRMGKWLEEVRQMDQKKATEYSTREDAARRFMRQNARLEPKTALHLAHWGMKQTKKGTWIWKFDPLHRTTSPQPFYAEQALEFLCRIQCPALLIWGKESAQSPRPDLKQRLKAVTQRTLVEIPQAGHMVHHDNPEELARVVMRFLDQQST